MAHCKLEKIVGSNNFSTQFIKIISHYKKIGYNINVLLRFDSLRPINNLSVIKGRSSWVEPVVS